MLNIRLIKGRIKSAKNIAQITKAMELVAASKIKKAQSLAINGRLYAQSIYELVFDLAKNNKGNRNPLLNNPKKLSGKKLIILISTNKGQCGGLNTNLFKFLYNTFGDSENNKFVTLGKKGAYFVKKLKGELVADFSEKTPFINIVPSLTEFAVSEFLKSNVDSVYVVYNDFKSALRQDPTSKQLIPLTIDSKNLENSKKLSGVVLIEPDEETIFNELIPHYLENQIRDAILEGEASEHSARMVAMRNATDNARGLISDLTLLHNKARQEKITSEILDMVTARAAVEG